MVFKATFNSISVKSGGLIKNKNKYDVPSNYINDYESWCGIGQTYMYVIAINPFLITVFHY